MLTADDFHRLLAALGEQGSSDVAWSEFVGPPRSPEHFASEAVFVICNSGMKHSVAIGIFDRCMAALREGRPVFEAFKHPGKVAAIESIWARRVELHAEYFRQDGPEAVLAFCESLPWIGGITKYHLAKNFGMNVAKPDVHLQRLADREGCSAQALCERLGVEVGLRAATVDVVLWRACAVGLLDSRSGALGV